MDEILKLLGVEKLDESQQTEIKEKLETLIEAKAVDRMQGKLDEEKEILVEEYENKFEEYKKDITSKFSNFVDSILEEELVIPEEIYEFAHKGELYSDIIEQFKLRMSIDEGVIEEEARNLLKEARDEIITLREELNGVIEESLEVQQDAQEMAANLYLRRKCDGLTEAQSSKIMSVLEGITDVETIDKKFDILVESMGVGKKSTCNECGKKDCICTKVEEGGQDTDGKGQVEVINEEKEVSDDAFQRSVDVYLKVLKENKF